MKNDLTRFERELLQTINFLNNTNYTYKNLMEWNTSEDVCKNNLKDGEKIYKSGDFYVTIKL